jgi:hypothetical protein
MLDPQVRGNFEEKGECEEPVIRVLLGFAKERLGKCRLPCMASSQRCRFSLDFRRECGKAASKSALVLMTTSEAAD